MTSPKQRAANKRNALKSSGPKSGEGKRRSSANATKHALSLPVNEHFFAKEIRVIAALVRTDCDSDSQAMELAKRIIDYERNEAFLMSQRGQDFHEEFHAWALSPQRMALAGLSHSHQNKERVEVTFTTSNKKPKGKERTEEIKFIEDFLKLQEKALLGKARAASNRLETSQRYQKRAIN